ncbi:MAG: S8 family serine peptidase [Coriobacteriales bacterium]|nr:S8 family serine peptidase [Coriobacteriales bacterium]
MKQTQGRETSQKAARKGVGKKTLRLLLSLLMVALLVPQIPAHAVAEVLSNQEEAITAISPQVTALEDVPTAVGATAEATAETSDEPESPAPQQDATFATLSEAEDAGAVAGVPSDPEAYIDNEVIVVLAGENTETNELASVEESLVEFSETDTAVATELLSPDLDGSSTALVELPADVSVADALLQLANDESVAFAQPNFCYTILDDEEFGVELDPEGLDESGTEEPSAFEPLAITNDPYVIDGSQWWLGAVKAYDAWDVQKSNGAVTVAVIDTGARLTHNDLKNNILQSLAWDASRGQLLSESVRKGQISNGGDPNTLGSHSGHGTHVAGIIAAQANNSQLGAGVSYNAKILPISVFSGSSTSTVTLRSAYDYVILHRQDANIRVVNMSLGGYDSEDNDTALRNKIIQARNFGILTVCAAGNGNTSATCYPSDYEEVISVVSVNQSLGHSSFSDYNEFKDIAAPGESIRSTLYDDDDASGLKSGTSMATAVVSGTAALLFAKNPTLTPAQVQQILCDTATDRGDPGRDDYYGYGLVNARAALDGSPHIVTFDPNGSGASVTPTSVIKNHNESIGTLPTPARTGYTFAGWYTAATNGTKIAETTTITANVTFYAHWTPNPYTITLNPQGGTGAPASVTRTHGSAVGDLTPNPTRTGYTFAGWYTAASGGTKVATTTPVTGNVTYYAQWANNGLGGSIVTISSALNNSKVLDIPRQSTSTGTRPTLWDNGNTPNQRFRLITEGNGYYVIQNVRSGLVLDLSGSRVNDGEITQWTAHSGDNQRWRLIANANGTYSIVSKVNEGYCIDLPRSSSANGVEPIVWARGQNQANQQFYLNVISRPLADGVYTIDSSASSRLAIDIPRSSRENGIVALLWTKTTNDNQRFRLTYNASTGYYTITNVNSNKVFDAGSGIATQGTQVMQWTGHGGYNQQWYIVFDTNARDGSYNIYSAISGLVFDASGGAASGNPLVLWKYHGSTNQRWAFTRA